MYICHKPSNHLIDCGNEPYTSLRMPENLVFYIDQYGYLALFFFIFLQEVGAPNPIPNELVLLFAGYLIFAGKFCGSIALTVVIVADLLAASVLYFVFHYFGSFLLNKNHRWVPVSQQTIQKQSQRIQNQGTPGVFFGRLTPFIRGYVAVISGLLHFRKRKYFLIILITSSIWASIYITAGYLLGPYWDFVLQNFEQFKYLLVAITLVVVLSYAFSYVWKKGIKGSFTQKFK